MSASPALRQAQDGTGRYRWWVLGVLTLAQGCHALDRAVIGLVLEPVTIEFGLTDNQAGLLAGLSYGAAFAIMAIPFGIAVDRFNRRNLLAVVLSLWSGLTVLCGFMNSYIGLLLARAAVGGAEAGGSPTGMSLLTDYFRPAQRASAVGYWYMSAGVGMLIAFMGGGIIAEHYGWRMVFIAAGIPGLLVAVLLLFTVREPVRGALDEAAKVRAGEKTDGSGLPFGRRLALIASAPGLVHCMIGLILIAVASSGIAAWLAPLLIRIHDFDLAEAGVAVALTLGLAGSVGVGLAGAFVDRLNKTRGYSAARSAIIAAAIITIAALSGAASFLSTSVVVSMAFLLLLGLFITAYNGPANGLIITISDPRVRGLSVALVQFGANLVGFGLGPVIIGQISEWAGGGEALRWGMMAILAFYLWGALHFLLAARAISRRTPATLAG